MTDDLFVAAWKKGIQKVGAEFFNIKASSEAVKIRMQMGHFTFKTGL